MTGLRVPMALVGMLALGYLGAVADAEDIWLSDCEIRGADSFGDYHNMYRWPPGEGAPIPFAWGQFFNDGDEFCHITSNTFSAQIKYQTVTPKSYLELKAYYANGGDSSTIQELTPGLVGDDDWKTMTKAFYDIEDVEEAALPFPASGLHFRLRENCGSKQVQREDGSWATVNIGDSDARFRVVSIGFAYGNWAANWKGMDFHKGEAEDNFDNVTLEHERATDYLEFTSNEAGQCTIQAYCRRKDGEDGYVRVKVNGSERTISQVTGTAFSWVDLWTGELAGGETIRLENNEWEESAWFGFLKTLHKSCVEFANESATGPVIRVVPVGSGGTTVVVEPPVQPADTTPPVLQNVAAGPVTHDAAILHFTADEDVQWFAEYGGTGAYGESTLARGSDDARSTSVTGLSPTTTYHFRIRATDRAGNTTISPDKTFTTAAAPDTTAPAISNIQVSLTHNSATVTWTTGEPANSMLHYGRTAPAATWTGLPDFVTSHSVTVQGLTPNTQYLYWVRSADGTGNVGSSAQASFTTPVPPDTVAPLILTHAAVDLTQTSARISWRTNEQASAAVEYGTTDAYGLRASAAGMTTEHDVALSGLQPNRAYSYRILTADAAGNATAQTGTFQTEPPDEGTISGAVYRQGTNAPLPGATVRIQGLGLTATTGANGSYSIAAVPTGERTVECSLAGYRTVRSPTTIRRMQTVTRNFLLTPVGTVYGYVKAPAASGQAPGSAAPRVSGTNGVEVRLMPGGRTTHTTRGCLPPHNKPTDGYYAFDDVPTGTHSVIVSVPGFVAQTLSVSLADPGQATRQDFSLTAAVTDVGVSDAGLTTNPPDPTAGQRVTVACAVTNLGNVDARGVKVRFAWEGALIGDRTISQIPPGETRQAAYAWTVPAEATGTGTLTATADPDNALAEAQEGNNTAARTVTVTPLKPDLSVLSPDVTHTPESPGSGQSVTVRATLKNMGTVTAQNVQVALKRGEEVLSTRSKTSLAPGDYYAASFSWTLPAATYSPVALSVVVDPGNSVDELDETNNQAEHVLIPAKPDLSVVDAEITSTPAAPLAGEDVRLTIKLRNLGAAKASGVMLRVLRDSDVLSQQTVSSISAGSSTTRYVTWDIPADLPGERTFKIAVDPDNAIPETDETNNLAAHVVTVTPRQVDLFIAAADITHTPATPEKGHSATISVVVHNGGNVKAAGVKVRFLRGGVQIGEKTISSISAGDDYTSKLTWTVPADAADSLTIQVQVDPGNAIAETSETNNSATHSFTVTDD